MSACSVLPFEINPHPTTRRTLAELYDRVDGKLTATIKEVARQKNAKVREGDSAAFEERSALRTAFRHLVTMCGDRPLELIDVAEIVDFTTEDFEQKLDISHRHAIKQGWARTKLLKYAAADGWWTCEAWQRWEAWSPIRAALTSSEGGSVGCQGIVTWAIRNGWWPATFSQKAMEAWILWMVRDQRRSLQTADQEEWYFRLKLNDAGLQGLLPNFPLARKSPPSHCLSRKSMRPELLNEITGITNWKMYDCEFPSRQVSADNLSAVLKAICGYATFELGICGITTVKQVIIEEIIVGFIPWLHHGREDDWTASWSSIRTMLGYVHALIQHKHPLFAGKEKEYAWFGKALRRIPKDSKEELRSRKIDKAVAYDSFAGIARNIRAELESHPDLDPLAKAILFRNYLFCLALCRHPWRQRNWRDCRTGEENRPNIYYGDIPDDVLRDMKISRKERDALKENPTVWLCHFIEDETKGGKEVWECLDTDLIDPMKLFIDVHRPELERRGPGSDKLFLTKSGHGMSSGQMIDLMAELSLRYGDTGKRLSPHIVRDIVVEHALANGCTFEQIQAMLWHVRSKSTQRYLSAFNASHAAVVLENHYAALDVSDL